VGYGGIIRVLWKSYRLPQWKPLMKECLIDIQTIRCLKTLGASISHIGRMANQSTDSLARLGAEQSESKPCPQPGNST
jgi:hypothetical protein